MDILDIMVKYVVYQCISIYEYQNLDGKKKMMFWGFDFEKVGYVLKTKCSFVKSVRIQPLGGYRVGCMEDSFRGIKYKYM